MIAYMMRMNSLIFIIATTMYLIFSLFKEIKNTKNIGDKVTLKVYRDKNYQNVELILEEQP